MSQFFWPKWGKLLAACLLFWGLATPQLAFAVLPEDSNKKAKPVQKVPTDKRTDAPKTESMTDPLDGAWILQPGPHGMRGLLVIKNFGRDCQFNAFEGTASAEQSCSLTRTGDSVAILSKVVRTTAQSWNPDNFNLQMKNSDVLVGRLESSTSHPVEFWRQGSTLEKSAKQKEDASKQEAINQRQAALMKFAGTWSGQTSESWSFEDDNCKARKSVNRALVMDLGNGKRSARYIRKLTASVYGTFNDGTRRNPVYKQCVFGDVDGPRREYEATYEVSFGDSLSDNVIKIVATPLFCSGQCLDDAKKDINATLRSQGGYVELIFSDGETFKLSK